MSRTSLSQPVTNPTDRDLPDAVASLRRELRQQQRRVRVLTWGVVTLAVALGAAGARMALAPVDATAFRLVTENNAARATLAIGPDGNALLTFFDAEGKALRAVGQFDDSPERLARVEAALAGLQRHLLVRDRAAGGLVFPERPDVIDDVQRDQTVRDLERLQQDLRNRQLELEREADRRRIELDELRREQDRRDLDRRMRERNNLPPSNSPFPR
jgi:hypothetical protein